MNKKHLDEMVGSFTPGSLVVIAGRHMCFKTTYAMGLSVRYTENNPDKHAAFFSMECLAKDLSRRLIRLSDYYSNANDKYCSSIAESCSKVEGLTFSTTPFPNIYVDDDMPLSVRDIGLRCCYLEDWAISISPMIFSDEVILQPGLIVVDYLQLLSPRDGINASRKEELIQNVEDLKQLAIDHDLCVVIVSTLMRGNETSKRVIPTLQGFDYGGIEELADIVLLLNTSEDDDSYGCFDVLTIKHPTLPVNQGWVDYEFNHALKK